MKRNDYVDFLKGILIYFVVLGHVIQVQSHGRYDFFENSIFKVIYTFHMPLFMAVSGYLFYFSICKKSTGEIIKNQIEAIIITVN